MNDDSIYENLDVLYRSRITLLDHLEDYGYNTAPYRKFSPKEIAEMLDNSPQIGASPAFQMDLDKKEDEQQEGEPTKCRVVYTIGKIKGKLQGFTYKLTSDEGIDFDPETMELIIITLEPIAPNFHAMAYQMWADNKVRVRYFQAAAIVNNPLKHVLQPKFEKISSSTADGLMKELYTKKSQLPIIRFHEDPVARLLGLMPDDIVKITRPSPTAGDYILYRRCVP
jgi:DNA-directed RNA polymerase subunit H (RpoH/RPB5)